MVLTFVLLKCFIVQPIIIFSFNNYDQKNVLSMAMARFYFEKQHARD